MLDTISLIPLQPKTEFCPPAFLSLMISEFLTVRGPQIQACAPSLILPCRYLSMLHAVSPLF